MHLRRCFIGVACWFFACYTRYLVEFARRAVVFVSLLFSVVFFFFGLFDSVLLSV